MTLPSDTPNSEGALQYRVGSWHRERFPDASVEHVALKAGEEVGEVMSAILAVVGKNSATGHASDPLGEAADVTICMMALVDRWFGGNLLDAVERKLAILTDPSSDHPSSLKATS